MQDLEALPLDVDLEIHAICLEYEAACKANQNPRIEDFLTRI